METPREAVERAFLTAHLLTASIPVAENITVRAIDLWNPLEESQELLFKNVVTAALRARVEQRRIQASPIISIRYCFYRHGFDAVLYCDFWLDGPRKRVRGCSAPVAKRVDDNSRLALQHLSSTFKREVIAAETSHAAFFQTEISTGTGTESVCRCAPRSHGTAYSRKHVRQR